MHHTSLRVQRLIRDLSEELLQAYRPEHAARVLEQAAALIRKDADARAVLPSAEWLRLSRGLSRRV